MNTDTLRWIASCLDEGLMTEGEANNRVHELLSPPWIPVANNQPQENQRVLISAGTRVVIAEYRRVISYDEDEDGEEIILDEGFGFLVDGAWYCGTKYWMFLPEPFKE